MPSLLSTRAALVSAACVVCAAFPADGQITVHSNAATVELTGRVHSQLNTTSVAGDPASEFLVRRARITALVEVNDLIRGKIQPEFAGGDVELKDAFLELDFANELHIAFGQFHRPFDQLDLVSSTEFLTIERDGEIRGVDTCAGVGGMCVLSQFTKRLEYAGRDIGIRMAGHLEAGELEWSAAATNGAGANETDDNGGKSFAGRVTVGLGGAVRLGSGASVHDYVDDGGTTRYGKAVTADIEVGDFDGGWHLQAAAVLGDNWRNPLGTDPTTFTTALGIVSYRFAIAHGDIVSAVEPVARVGLGDPDRSTPDDGGTLLTPGIIVHFTGRNHLAANLDVWVPSAGTTEWSLKMQSYLYF